MKRNNNRIDYKLYSTTGVKVQKQTDINEIDEINQLINNLSLEENMKS